MGRMNDQTAAIPGPLHLDHVLKLREAGRQAGGAA
jgi:hypothetical protein